MKTALMILGVLFLVLIVLVAGLVGYSLYVGKGLDASSKAYVDTNVPIIITNWSPAELKKRASPQLLKAATDLQIAELFTKLSGLGPLQHYDGSKGDSNISYTTQNGKLITAAYLTHATFQKGKIDIEIKLIQLQGQWLFLGFHVGSHAVD